MTKNLAMSRQEVMGHLLLKQLNMTFYVSLQKKEVKNIIAWPITLDLMHIQ